MPDEPTQIRDDIEETRERLSQTIEEIGERLNPQVLTDNVKETVRDATIGRVRTMARNAADAVGRTTSGVAHTIRDNPVPAAFIAVGVGWMLWNSRASAEPSRMMRADMDPERERERGRDIGYGDEYGLAYSGRYGQEYGHESSAADRVKEKAAHLADSVKDTAQRLTHQTTDRAQQMAGQLADTSRRQVRRVEDTFHDNPLMIGAIALAAGLAAGLAVPVSERERTLVERTPQG